MISFIAGAALLALGLYGLKVWTGADPKVLVKVATRTLAYAALVAAVVLLALGRITVALPLGLVGLVMLGRLDPARIGGPFGAVLGGLFRPRAAPRVSRVASGLFEMELDHASGSLSGRIVSGPHAGALLDDLDLATLVALRAGCDAQSLSLLEAYLDRRAPAWRENAQGDAGGGDLGGAARARSGAMTEQEAYQVLGLEPGAGLEAIRAAHRSLMKKLHPDQGGSDYLAARVNQAKDILLDVLLREHR